ncbi:MFS transporter [Streptomyces cinnamoneus]|uniref:MFS transporter n=1 Tax=Streptomyces cinnamoneus TaxID=53446 RepID=A0A2G1XFX8_STRCJ|nr:MFS transporter [Streptomyces cinnamoneus]PHQ50144.1 MFS transporter [Streptomyces cinnamoneus]PPT13074.1 MFS transporter [Streptomyces cinnamoneus]
MSEPRIASDAPSPTTPAPSTTSRSSASPTPALSPLGLATVLLGAALPFLDFFIVNVALPTIDHDLDAGPALLEMVVGGYGVAYAVLLVLGGRLGDMVGRRRLFLWGTAAFGVTSVACGLAPDAWTLVAARVAQGAAAALMLPQVLATIQATTAGHRRTKALSLYSGTAGVVSAVGQVLGGVLVSVDLAGTGWRSIFLINAPIAVVAFVLALRAVPETRSDRPTGVDGWGTVLLSVTLVSLLLPLTEGRSTGWPVWSWVLLAVFPVAAVAFVVVERREERAGRTPLVPPSLLRVHAVRSGLALITPFSIGWGGFMFVLAVALQEGLRLGPLAAGLALVPMCVTFFVGSLAGPRLAARYGRRLATAGALIQAAGLLMVAGTFWFGWDGLDALGTAPGLAVQGLGQGLLMPMTMRLVLSEVPVDKAGVGSGVLVTTQQAFMALGVATLGSLFLSLTPHTGMREALAITWGVQLVTVVVTVLLTLRLPRSVS